MGGVIAEIGLNHGGDINNAKLLIKKAKKARCWGVKFQFRNIETFYNNTDEVSDMTIYDEIKRNQLSLNDYEELAIFCKNQKIKFGVSFFRAEDFWALSNILDLVDFIKVPSSECLNFLLIEELLNTRKEIFLSTGGQDTKNFIEKIAKYKKQLIVLHCISNYPVKLGEQDLNVIKTFRKSGFKDVGYSSHDSEWEVCILALSKGASWIERHITLDKKGKGLDDTSSSIPSEFKKLVKFALHYKDISGEGLHKPNQGELINIQNLGTSLYAVRDIDVGETTNWADFSINAPRTGLSIGEYSLKYINKKLTNRLRRKQPLTNWNFSNGSQNISLETKNFAKHLNLGLPVRLHDYKLLKQTFDVGTYEFHLSFSEVLSDTLSSTVSDISANENISIHLPDYIPGNSLMDPISENNDIRARSKEIIEIVCNWGKRIEQKIGKNVNIIGSFSCVHEKTKEKNLNKIFDFIDSKANKILPQWLPVYAWYFGGSVKLELFNSEEDIDYIVKNQRKICLDFSHLAMSAHSFEADWKDWYRKLYGTIEHLHISDSSGSTAEGLMIGDGSIGDFSKILLIDKIKIIEPWQGHLNQGEGFLTTLDILYRQFKHNVRE